MTATETSGDLFFSGLLGTRSGAEGQYWSVSSMLPLKHTFVAFVKDDVVLPLQGLYGATQDVCIRVEKYG